MSRWGGRIDAWGSSKHLATLSQQLTELNKSTELLADEPGARAHAAHCFARMTKLGRPNQRSAMREGLCERIWAVSASLEAVLNDVSALKELQQNSSLLANQLSWRDKKRRVEKAKRGLSDLVLAADSLSFSVRH